MLYRDGIRLEREDLQEHIEILQQKFPTFFRKESPLPIKIDYIKSAKFYIDLFRPGGETSAGRVLKSPQPKKIKSYGFDVDDGFKTEVRYSEKAPSTKGGDIKWVNSLIEISSETILRPSVDLEKLIFLWFYSDNFVNNYCENKRKDAKFEFIIPEVQVESKYDNIKYRRRLEDEILIEDTRISYDSLKSIAKLMNISLRGEEKVDRITFFDNLVNNPSRVKNYDAIKGNQVPEKGTTVDEVVSLTNVKNLVASLVDGLKLFEDESVNKWRIKGPGKAKYLCDVDGDSEEAKMFNLVEYVSNNPEAFEIVKGLVK
jgi:hypothetical protein